MSGIEIVSVRAVPVSVPTAWSLVSNLGVQRTSDYALVIVRAADGTVGVGEISLIWHGGGAVLAPVVNDLVAPRLIGRDAWQLTDLIAQVRECLQFGWHSLTAVAAIEMALLDLLGKTIGQPVVNLLGGAAHDRLRASMSLSIGPVDAVLDEAELWLQRGFRAFKVKSGSDVQHCVDTVAALRERYADDVTLRVDLNMALRQPKAGVRQLDRLCELGVISIEQPCPPDDLDGLRWLREHVAAPIMADESVWSLADATRVLRAGAVDLVNIYVSEAGGLREAGKIADASLAAGVGIAVGSMPELAVGTSAAQHFAFSRPELDHPSDLVGHLYHADDVVHHSLSVDDGWVIAPTAPGLGVAVDPVRLERYATADPGDLR